MQRIKGTFRYTRCAGTQGERVLKAAGKCSYGYGYGYSYSDSDSDSDSHDLPLSA